MTKKNLALAAAGLCAALAWLPAAQAAGWTATQLTLPGLPGSGAGMNNLGQVYGGYIDPADSTKVYGFYTGVDGVGVTTLGTMGGNRVTVTGMNDAGVLVGTAEPGSTTGYLTRAFTVQPGQTALTELPIGAAATESTIAPGINNAGQVVAGTLGIDKRSYLTDTAGTAPLRIGTGISAQISALALNASGQVTGGKSAPACSRCQLVGGAFVTGANGIGFTDLGTLGGGIASGQAINDRGQVAGNSQYTPGVDYNNPYHAFIAGPDIGGMRDLGTFGGTSSDAYDINSVGQVVGSAQLASGISHAFVTGADGMGGLTDLNSLVHLADGSYLTTAVDINERGQILAYSSSGGLYLLRNPVPEPSTWALVGLGMFSAGAAARRRRAA